MIQNIYPDNSLHIGQALGGGVKAPFIHSMAKKLPVSESGWVGLVQL